MTDWLTALGRLRAGREPAVLVTVTAVRGHAPREAGAKLVVGRSTVSGSVGGGNLEAVAVDHARKLLQESGGGVRRPEQLSVPLSDKAPYQHGVQCCGGEVGLLFEPMPVPPAVAVFGVGHVGLELARILARHELDLHLVDTRPEQLTDERLAVLADAVAVLHVHRVPLLPESVLDDLPSGGHLVIMTHDHAEDIALCDAALRADRFGTVGLIGSAGKWARFRRQLIEAGHPAEAVEVITTPIGVAGLDGKEPAVIAVSAAAWLLGAFAAPAPG
ncbi:MAG: xanthine dehydrogenase accessory protein XdhC [Thermocrispum sp.]